MSFDRRVDTVELVQDRINRLIYPSLIPRCLAVSTLATLVAWAHSHVRNRILMLLPGRELQEMYFTVTATILIGPAILGIMGAVVGYFYWLRNRQHQTDLSEAAFAFRSICAALLGFLAFGVVFAANFDW